MALWRRDKTTQDGPTMTPAQRQERTDEIVMALKEEAARAKIITGVIQRRVDLLEAQRGATA